MGRLIKLVLYYFAYQLAFYGIFSCGYMLYQHTTDLPTSPNGDYMNCIIWAQALATVAMGIHLIAGKYVALNRQTWSGIGNGRLMLTSIAFMVGMGLWSNYLSEKVALPNNLQEVFNYMMQHPLGILSITILAPIVEELLFRGAIQGHLMRLWRNPTWSIVIASLTFGIVHGNPAQVPFAFILGLALGWIYYRTGSLLPNIIMHFVNNTTAVASFLTTKNPEATMTSTFGATGALGAALLGGLLTLVCIWYIQTKLTAKPTFWKNEEEH